jgi:hypothetical protein
MKGKIKWERIISIIGVVALIIGALDHLEGSIVIAAGSSIITLSTYLTKGYFRKPERCDLFMFTSTNVNRT